MAERNAPTIMEYTRARVGYGHQFYSVGLVTYSEAVLMSLIQFIRPNHTALDTTLTPQRDKQVLITPNTGRTRR